MTEDLRLSFFRLVGAIEMHEKVTGAMARDFDDRLYRLAREEAAKHQVVLDEQEGDQ